MLTKKKGSSTTEDDFLQKTLGQKNRGVSRFCSLYQENSSEDVLRIAEEKLSVTWQISRSWLCFGFFADVAATCCIESGQFITTSAEVTPNGGLVRESPPKWP